MIGKMLPLPGGIKDRFMYIVYLTTELAPIAKVGGLGDVITGLAKALKKKGAQVEVILPFYDHIPRDQLQGLKIEMQRLISYKENTPYGNTIWSAECEGVSLLLIEPDKNMPLFQRGRIYGEDDDNFRFTYFTKTAMEYLLKKGKKPDILHLNDWLTSLGAPLYYKVYQSKGLKIGSIVTTIHNMQYQGICSQETFKQIGIKTQDFLTDKALQDQSNPKILNLLKGGLIYSDFLTTVSPTYAQEIQETKGFGLENILRENKGRLQGILNGIDTDYWNPETDPLIETNYPADGNKLPAIKQAKKANQKALYSQLNMEDGSAPLFTCISRIVQQKGPELIRVGIEYILKKGGRFILLGSASECTLQKEFSNLSEKYQGNPHVHFHFLFDEKLAHLTYAAADCILIPSLFEPCGLTQMIALRYAALPIVHQVGGLNDTIFDIDCDHIPLKQRNGYTFDSPSADKLRASIDRAFEHYYNNQEKWETMQKNGLARDWSWDTPSKKYLNLYHSASLSRMMM